MKLYDLGILAIIATILISAIAGAVIENDKDIIKNEKRNGD